MAATLAGVSLSSTTSAVSKAEIPKQQVFGSPTGNLLQFSWKTKSGYKAGRVVYVRPVASSPSTPPGISDKVSESIKKAEETCSENAQSGECVAAWDEVEELSAAASHARDKLKSSDPLETFCKDNPETDECRTYDN